MSGPGLSQIVFGTPSRPRSWSRPARRTSTASERREPEVVGGRGREVGNAPRVTQGVGRLDVDEVGDGLEGAVELGLVQQAGRRTHLPTG